jgi:Icc-related predicted phosphoesterase
MNHVKRLLITSDLHQHARKWDLLVKAAIREQPATVLIAGDLLPKHHGIPGQKRFFPDLRRLLTVLHDQLDVKVLLFLSNDDGHFLEPLVDDLETDRLCVNMNQRIFRDGRLVFCGMNKVRDYPFGYKHYCVPDGDWVSDPIQYCGEGVTFNENGQEQRISDLRRYLLAKPSLVANLNALKSQLQPGEMARSVWLVHQPPASLGMDICADGRKVGSPGVLSFIQDNQPLLGCSGHIHESPHQPGGQWAAKIGNTTWVQPGQMGCDLYYVTVDVADDYVVTNVRHSIFGEAINRLAKDESLPEENGQSKAIRLAHILGMDK